MVYRILVAYPFHRGNQGEGITTSIVTLITVRGQWDHSEKDLVLFVWVQVQENQKVNWAWNLVLLFTEQ